MAQNDYHDNLDQICIFSSLHRHLTFSKHIAMVTKSTRLYNHVGESTRVRIVALREHQFSLTAIAKKTNVKKITVQAILTKWNRFDTIQDLSKSG
jgi:hypothetical protein